jgi:hypothetical protein
LNPTTARPACREDSARGEIPLRTKAPQERVEVVCLDPFLMPNSSKLVELDPVRSVRKKGVGTSIANPPQRGGDSNPTGQVATSALLVCATIKLPSIPHSGRHETTPCTRLCGQSSWPHWLAQRESHLRRSFVKQSAEPQL